MKPDFEPPRPHTRSMSFAAFERADERFDFHWHYHPELELTWIIDSQGERLVGDHIGRYRAGDLVFLGANLPHTWASEGTPRGRRHRAIVVQFRPEVIPRPLRELDEFRAVEDLFVRAARGLYFPGPVSTAAGRRLRLLMRQRGVDAWVNLLQTLSQLAEARARPLASLRFTPDLPLARQARFQRALDYIETRNDPDLSLRVTAQAAGVSPATLVRMFRRMLGRTFVSYVNDLRISRTCRQLIETDRGIAEIAYGSGFNNLANFNRCFRAIKGMTPSEFRRHHNVR